MKTAHIRERENAIVKTCLRKDQCVPSYGRLSEARGNREWSVEGVMAGMRWPDGSSPVEAVNIEIYGRAKRQRPIITGRVVQKRVTDWLSRKVAAIGVVHPRGQIAQAGGGNGNPRSRFVAILTYRKFAGDTGVRDRSFVPCDWLKEVSTNGSRSKEHGGGKRAAQMK